MEASGAGPHLILVHRIQRGRVRLLLPPRRLVVLISAFVRIRGPAVLTTLITCIMTGTPVVRRVGHGHAARHRVRAENPCHLPERVPRQGREALPGHFPVNHQSPSTVESAEGQFWGIFTSPWWLRAWPFLLLRGTSPPFSSPPRPSSCARKDA